MKRLEELPKMTDRALAGLEATPGLKYRVMEAAKSQAQPVRKRPVLARTAAALAVCAMMIAIVLPPMLNSSDKPLISSMPLGSATDSPALLSDNGISGGSLNSARSGSNVWSIFANEGSFFPMIGVQGRYYRMLAMPASVSSGILGSSLGTVTQYTTEPALAGSDGVMSNVCPSGTEVYSVKGMNGTFVAANVNGKLRVFQRVSFNGSALVGGDRLSDTLNISGHVVMLELSGVGSISDRNVCNQLISTLLSSATYESNSSVQPSQTLIITLDNGLMLQLDVKNEKFSACGTWSCPDFFEAYQNAMY